MNIAYILYPEVIISGQSNGIRSQAENWAVSLKRLGHSITFINNWKHYDWKSFDIIHLFGCSGSWHNDVAFRLKHINPNICFSPIIDPKPIKLENKSIILKNYIRILFPFTRFLTQDKYDNFKLIFVRSQCEAEYLTKIKGVDISKLAHIPLAYSYKEGCISEGEQSKRKPFCLHISSITQERKNVLRLIKAAKKYNFELVLAGNKGTPEAYYHLEKEISGCDNIKVLGFISEEKKLELYKTAKVFALPSLYEGVGIVAVDAALYGCEIVISDIPGPKEYYAGMASLVNPYSVDEIGYAIKGYLDGKVTTQPILSEHIKETYSPSHIAKQLESAYYSLMQ
ncbi:MAG TPA: hypothetical protein DCE73_00780 [Paraprevotella xylaniphila]|uniref:Glycosyltransferase, group 1 family protein n=1 Tax=Paraprevotella xylaniphila YIT 11841 TaxID=762982 RepID=F3QW85_9BACT|nr:glycosyltransferase family 4 protein [Paraprevotella xylaniphila]EGG52191.1 glycosyltransferase, group 1 family protein [Paraprevotella xylaniphila YIT 11841]HAC41739.1 hypothetical protein [Paraprevotella xylaniphila]